MSSLLFNSFKLNEKIQLKNRIIMAPMTRNMAHDDLSPTKTMAEYYAMRADAGLIITEGTIIRPDSRGYTNVPGIYLDKHVEGWKRVTDQVHEKDGLIFSQIWHVGRVSHPYFLDGELPISASATEMTGRVKRIKLDLIHGKCRAVTINEIKGLVESYAIAAKNAIKAGFDGIEIHGANGYLIDQFLHYHTNLRKDEYGETPENMARFAIEIVKACGETIGFQRVAIRLSPGAYLNEIVGDARDAEVFKYLIKTLNQFDLAYIHTGSFDDKIIYAECENKTMTQFMRTYSEKTHVACGGYDVISAENAIKENHFDLIAMGRLFIANPDLIKKLKNQETLVSYDVGMLEKLI